MAGVFQSSSHVSGYYPRQIFLFLVLLSTPASVLPATVSGSSYTGFPAESAAHAGGVNSPVESAKQVPLQFAPADAGSVHALKSLPAISSRAPEGGNAPQRGIPPDNRLLLFFLLLMAGVFGLLIDIATTRRQG